MLGKQNQNKSNGTKIVESIKPILGQLNQF